MYPVNLMMKMSQVVIRQYEGYTQHKPDVVDYYEPFRDFVFVCFVALRPKSTAMVIAGQSVYLTTLFPGQA